MRGSVAPDRTASNSACVAGDAVWWTISSVGTVDHHPTGEPWWRTSFQPPSMRTKRLVAAIVPVGGPVDEVLVERHPGDVPGDDGDVVGDDELVAPRTVEDPPPRLLHDGPAAQDRPAGMHAHDALAVVPHRAHRLQAALFEGVVERRVGGEDVLGHGSDPTDRAGARAAPPRPSRSAGGHEGGGGEADRPLGDGERGGADRESGTDTHRCDGDLDPVVLPPRTDEVDLEGRRHEPRRR